MRNEFYPLDSFKRSRGKATERREREDHEDTAGNDICDAVDDKYDLAQRVPNFV